jgi:hypothetical protein
MLVGNATPSPTSDPPGYFCGDAFTVLKQVDIYVMWSTSWMVMIGVPPDYHLPYSDKYSGMLDQTQQDDLVASIPVQNANQHQDVFRMNTSGTPMRQQRVCASNTTGATAIKALLDQFYRVGGGKPSNSSGLPSLSLDPGTWVRQALLDFWDYLWKQIVLFLQQIIDWCSTLGFIWITPAALSYKNPMVLAGANWALGALDGYVALLLVMGGYQILFNHSLGEEQRSSLMGVALRTALAAVAAHLGFFLFLPSIIELSNTASWSIMGALRDASAGDVSLPLGAINWLAQPLSWATFIIIDFLASLLLIAVDAVRLAVLDVTILLSPFWIMAYANATTRSWGRLGATTFFSALFVQPIQTATLSLGAGFIANFGHLNPNEPALCQNLPASAHAACLTHLGNASFSGSVTVMALVLGIATIYVAMKIPGMFFSSAIRASMGSVNGDIARLGRTVLNLASLRT